jgi:apolipoprotein D and lipocalin family protein
MHKQWKKIISFICAGVALSACAGTGPEMKTVDYVDIDRFMGPWYVIANIPTFLEKGAHNAVETYSLNDDGTIGTTFTFRKNSFDGKPKEYNPKAFILDTATGSSTSTMTTRRRLSPGKNAISSGSWHARQQSTMPNTMIS